MLITPFGKVDDTHFIDPHTKQIVEYDHANKVCFFNNFLVNIYFFYKLKILECD